jgi:hypothetical protein
MRLIWLNEAVAANVSDEANASNAAWVDMADVNKSNNGKLDFCQTTTSSSSVSFPLFAFSRSPSQKNCNTFAEMKECFGIMRCINKLGLPVVHCGESGQQSP